MQLAGDTGANMSEAVATALVGTIPAVLWVVLAAVVYLSIRRALLPQIGRLSSVKTAVVELSFAEKLLDEAAVSPSGGEGPAPSASERRAALSRLERAVDILKDGRILWVDDNPEWNRSLITLFQQLDMAVDTARSTNEALTSMRSHSYDLVITDMNRDTEQPSGTAGITLIDGLGRMGNRLPILIFAANFDPMLGVPAAVFGYTNDANDAVHLVIDVMERVKYGTAF